MSLRKLILFSGGHGGVHQPIVSGQQHRRGSGPGLGVHVAHPFYVDVALS